MQIQASIKHKSQNCKALDPQNNFPWISNTKQAHNGPDPGCLLSLTSMVWPNSSDTESTYQEEAREHYTQAQWRAYLSNIDWEELKISVVAFIALVFQKHS